jgi:single-strand DNA-binding protein
MTILTTFVGRVGKDAVTRFTQGGDPIVGFSLAADNGFGDKKQTLWFDASGFGKRYEAVCPYLLKGAQVWVAGEQGEREHDGKVYKTLRLTDLQLVGGKPDTGNGTPRQNAPKPQRRDPAPAFDQGDSFQDSDIPFATNRGTF